MKSYDPYQESGPSNPNYELFRRTLDKEMDKKVKNNLIHAKRALAVTLAIETWLSKNPQKSGLEIRTQGREIGKEVFGPYPKEMDAFLDAIRVALTNWI